MKENEGDVQPEEYHRAMVEAFVYYLSSHARDHRLLIAEGVRDAVKQWLEDQARPKEDLPISHQGGVATEFHAVLEDIYTRIDDYGQLSRQWGRAKAQAEAKGKDPFEVDHSHVYDVEKQLKLEVEKLVTENVRLNHMLEDITGGGFSFEEILKSAIGEWLEKKGDVK